MSKQKKNIPGRSATTTAKPAQQVHVKQSPMNERNMNIALLAGVSVITFICYHYSLHNQFLVDWDDWMYITKDKFLTSFTAAHVNNILFRDITHNIYHPLTMLSLALNYHFSQLNPMGYYLTNILLHILNTILIFYLIKILMEAMVKVGYKAMPVIPWLVAVGALLHGIHPMHVESVSWVVERKDLLYAAFYFIGLIMYVLYTEGARFKWMLYVNIFLALCCTWGIIGLSGFSINLVLKGRDFSIPDTILFGVPLLLLVMAIVAELKFKNFKMELFYVLEFFILSLLSKPSATAFPLSILVIDFFLKRDVQFISKDKSLFYNEAKALVRLSIEKWMFFVVVVLSGIITIYIQLGVKSLVFTNGYTVIQKFLIACYTFTMYTVKAFYPADLSSYYPFPPVTSEYYLPTIFYVAPLFALAIVFIPLYLARKNKDIFRVVLFGLGFYFVNVVFFLQFISSGATIISERYSYMCYFGLVFILVYLAHWLWQKSKSYHIAIQGAAAVVCITLGYLCYERTKVWHNAETLWSDVALKYNEEQLPYFNLGNYYIDSGKYDKAYAEYVVLARLRSKEPEVYRNLAMIYGMRKQFDSSFYYFGQAIHYDTNDPTIYNNRGITYANLGKFDLALKDFKKAYSMDTTQIGTLTYIANILIQTGQYDEAIRAEDKLIEKLPEDPSNYMQRGNAYLNDGNAEMAIKDYLHVLELQPKNGECMYNLSVSYHKLNDRNNTLKYATMAQAAGAKLPDGYLQTLR